MITIETFIVGHIATNCYIITDTATNRRAVVDPGYKSAELTNRIKELGTDTFDYILLTHGHFDHIWFAIGIRELTGAKIVISEDDAPFLTDGSLNLSANFGLRNISNLSADVTLKDGDYLMLGNTCIKFIRTPGHTIGSGCYVSFEDKIVFSGDTLFKLSIGRTDFVTGNEAEIKKSLNRLASLEGDFDVLPGHGDKTTLDYERKNNPYVSE